MNLPIFEQAAEECNKFEIKFQSCLISKLVEFMPQKSISPNDEASRRIEQQPSLGEAHSNFGFVHKENKIRNVPFVTFNLSDSLNALAK